MHLSLFQVIRLKVICKRSAIKNPLSFSKGLFDEPKPDFMPGNYLCLLEVTTSLAFLRRKQSLSNSTFFYKFPDNPGKFPFIPWKKLSKELTL